MVGGGAILTLATTRDRHVAWPFLLMAMVTALPGTHSW
jgi:hypothetical protein